VGPRSSGKTSPGRLCGAFARQEAGLWVDETGPAKKAAQAVPVDSLSHATGR
jgi:hypothetical protein